jgi:hypothetical protein
MIYFLLLIYGLNLFYIYKKGLYNSSFIIHFFFISLIFIGPAVYYELGGLTYAHSFEWEDVITFELYGISVFACSLIFSYFLAHKRKSLFNRYFANYSTRNKNLTFLYFFFWYVLVLAYLLVYYNHIPIVRFILTGSLPERLDQSDSIKLFYTFSSFFMVFIPSGYFFFVRYLKTNLLRFGLLLLVVFILTSGGHKGLVTFFAIFAIFFSGFKFNLKYIVIGVFALSGLLTIYVLSKGRDFSKETFLYLLESPPRRFFVTQGSAFITRISMDRNNLYVGDVNEYQLIKRETFQAIYPGVNEKGAAPTFFLGDLHVRYGYIFAMLSYLLFLMFIFPFVKGLDSMKDRRLYIWWNLFVFFLLLGNAELSYTSALRCLLALGNLVLILIIPTLRISQK